MSIEHEFKHGLTVVGIARKHGLTRQQVEAHLRRILERLKGIIEDIALVTAYDEKLPGSIAGHVKALTTDLAADLARTRAALEEIAEDADGVAAESVVGVAERRTWRSIARKARAALEGRG